MGEITRTNYLVVVSFKDNDLPRSSRFMVYNALNSKHALNSVLSTGTDHVPYDAEVTGINVVKNDPTSRVVKI